MVKNSRRHVNVHSPSSPDGSMLVRKGRVIRPLGSRFDPDLVIHGASQLLLTAEVMLGRLDGHMPEQELDLVEFTAGQMTEAGTCAPAMPHAA